MPQDQNSWFASLSLCTTTITFLSTYHYIHPIVSIHKGNDLFNKNGMIIVNLYMNGCGKKIEHMVVFLMARFGSCRKVVTDMHVIHLIFKMYNNTSKTPRKISIWLNCKRHTLKQLYNGAVYSVGSVWWINRTLPCEVYKAEVFSVVLTSLPVVLNKFCLFFCFFVFLFDWLFVVHKHQWDKWHKT